MISDHKSRSGSYHRNALLDYKYDLGFETWNNSIIKPAIVEDGNRTRDDQITCPAPEPLGHAASIYS